MMGMVTSVLKYFWGSSEDESVVDPATGLSKRQKRLITESWQALTTPKKELKTNGVTFFIDLFKAYPYQQDYFPLFKNESLEELKLSPKMRAHATTVMSQIGTFVDNLDDPECLVGLVEKVAVAHIKRGIPLKPFEELRIMFGSYLKHCFGDQATPEVLEAWDKLLAVMNTLIKAEIDK